MLVKICGIMTEEAGVAACDLGADLLGFVFAESKREISPEKAAEIRRQLPESAKTVGVFVNETQENIIRIAETAHLDYVQLHGEESADFCRDLPYPVIKAFSIKKESDLDQLMDYDCDYYLLDSPGVQFAGGSGIPFDWNLLKEKHLPNEQLILAGGLNAENVQKAIEKVRPAIVDVSSGVEKEGHKDLAKIAEFIQKAKYRGVKDK
ncbi:phosphoribosylanthranilate isomerase [Bacillus niameyensis]|uniref:phosphoribosylanthranilate isomerase n=1 Tax=Bacillus niameyensis TaxID=1522308 RepID=UPI000782A3F1|nr:phosphoribosylanthranilate isomerase [Bacillus niameyensis]